MNKANELSGENYKCFPLQWDTDYFGINSARVILNGAVSTDEQNSIIEYCENYNFVTVFNSGNLNENNYWIGTRTKAFLVDMNIQFTKHLTCVNCNSDTDILFYNSYPRNEELINITKTAFQYSRFFNDPRLPKNQAQGIYLYWTECAFNKEDKYFAICKRGHSVLGFILFTIDVKIETTVIELIAVDDKHRGQKVGKTMITALESFLYARGIKKIRVGTQINNVLAISFYTSVGFQNDSCNAVYHMWSNLLEC